MAYLWNGRCGYAILPVKKEHEKLEFAEGFYLNCKSVISRCSEKWDNYYLYDESCILKNIEHLKMCFPQVDFLYSIKCNSNPHVLRSVFGQGLGADAASAGEVQLANEAGLAADRIYYSAPGKSVEDIEKCISKAVLIADSIDEVKRIQTIAERSGRVTNIGIRINPDFTFAGDGGKPSKFGIDEEQAIRLVKNNPYRNIRVVGLHIHLKSQELDAGVLSAYYKKVFLLAERFAQFCDGLDYINMGSGMGVPYAPTDSPLNLSMLRSAVKNNLEEFLRLYPDTRIIIEVGRYAVCKCGFYVTKVMDRKVSYGKTYLILKNTLNGFIRPSLAKLVEHYAADNAPAGAEPLFTATDAFAFLTLKEDAPSETVTLVGNICTATDVIAENITMPHLECNDIVVITNAGSYAAVLSPFQFSSQEKPAELFLTKNGEVVYLTNSDL